MFYKALVQLTSQSGGSQQTCDAAANILSGRNPRAASSFTSHSTLARAVPVTAKNRFPWFNSTIAAGRFFCNIKPGVVTARLNANGCGNTNTPAIIYGRVLNMATAEYKAAARQLSHTDCTGNQAPWLSFWGMAEITLKTQVMGNAGGVFFPLCTEKPVPGWKSLGSPLSFYRLISGTNLCRKTMADWQAWPMS